MVSSMTVRGSLHSRWLLGRMPYHSCASSGCFLRNTLSKSFISIPTISPVLGSNLNQNSPFQSNDTAGRGLSGRMKSVSSFSWYLRPKSFTLLKVDISMLAWLISESCLWVASIFAIKQPLLFFDLCTDKRLPHSPLSHEITFPYTR